MPWGQFNQLFYDITSAIQNWQQNTIAPFITTAMNGGTPYTYPQYAMVLKSGVGYISLVGSNADTPPSTKWGLIPLGQDQYWCGTSTGSANAQILTTGFSLAALVAGAKFSFIAGYTNTSTCGITIDSASSENAYANGSSGLALVAANGLIAGNVYTVTWNGVELVVGSVSSGISRILSPQVFLSSGTYTPTAGMLYCTIEAWGGGGGGGGVSARASATAGGGAAGSYARLTASAATIGSSQTVTIGAAGAAGANTGGTGGTGGTTSVGSLCVAVGGLGGVGCSTNAASAGGAGQAATAGDITGTGAPGGASTQGSGTPYFISGEGGSTSLGGGGLAIAGVQSAGNAGVANTGGGGSGAASTGTGEIGGAGGTGYVVITEYLS